MKYRIQRSEIETVGVEARSRRRWKGVEAFEADSDLEAADRFLDVCRSAERRSPTPSTTPLRMLDEQDVAVATFTPNPTKLAKGTER